jgi:Ca2+-transporting ATPase
MNFAALGAAERDSIFAANVLARVSPENKLDLVALYQKRGDVVAMTGDGVNDAPALKKADIGIAMGGRGTEVAREAAAMVLKDDSFATIVTAIGEGRVILNNIRRFVVYLLSCNISEILVIGLATLAGLPLPLLPLQILYLNLVTDVFPAFAVAMGEGSDDVMRSPPRKPDRPIIDRRQWLGIIALGVLITASTLGAFVICLEELSLSHQQATTVAFTSIALAQLWNVFNMRGRSESVFLNSITRNPYVWAASALCLALIAVPVYVPALGDVLGLVALDRGALTLAIGASIAPLLVGQLWLALAGLTARG